VRRNSFIAGIILALLLSAALVAVASAAPTQITDAPANQGRPDVQGDIIVWKDFRSGNWDIYGYDLSAPVLNGFVVSASVTYENVPATNGTHAFWQNLIGGTNDLFMRELPGGLIKTVASGPGHQGLPATDGNLVVYVSDALGNNDIFMADITDPDNIVTTPVCTNAARQWQPRISGSAVIWEDSRGGDVDIWMREMPGGSEQPVATGSGNQKVADIDGRNIVWQSDSGGQHSVWMKNLDDNVPVLLASGMPLANSPSPRISQDLIVWQSGTDIHGRDLTSGQDLVIASGSQIQAYPAVDREIVVWEEVGANGYDIWMDRIADVTPPEIGSIEPAEGAEGVCLSPVISAGYADNRSGVDAGSVTLSLDGQDVTGAASVSGSSVSYDATAIGPGPHTVSLSASDQAGNTATRDWSFTAAGPVLRLFLTSSYWPSMQAFDDRILSVDYSIANDSAHAEALGASIVGAPSTSGVVMTSTPPVPVGTIGVLSASGVTIEYSVPSGVQGFRSSIYLETQDSCGTMLYLPGPLP